MPEALQREKSNTGGGDEGPLPYTSLFMTGLRCGIPWNELVGMSLTTLTMMVDSTRPPAKKKVGGREVRDATQADIDAFF